MAPGNLHPLDIEEGNLLVLASDNDPRLLPILRKNKGLASVKDSFGYNCFHAAVSYDHLDLAQAMVKELDVDVNILDDDNETALYLVETLEAAKLLVEELNINYMNKNKNGHTAQEKLAEEGEFNKIAVYLKVWELEHTTAEELFAKKTAGEKAEKAEKAEKEAEAAKTKGKKVLAKGAANAKTNSAAKGKGKAPKKATFADEADDAAEEDPVLTPVDIEKEFKSFKKDELVEVADPDLLDRIKKIAIRDDYLKESGQLELRKLVANMVKETGSRKPDRLPRDV
ncbi:hypothetical protein BJ878DRAFT_538421 [Calycina marina]|uniref:Ankyrin repeat protein n=1 Tax=Calycina marina TaxID=1763456 RepID=A0A9P7ZAC4_9HELO|nr:hypothetical protein BJ878DRAFT_538421 [Calycina marina]